MNFHVDRRLLLVAAVLGAVGLFAIGFFVALGVRAVVAGPDSAPVAQAPVVSHTHDQIVLPGGTWPGLDADFLDGLDSTDLQTTSLPWSAITDKPAGFADDVDDDVLGGLSCANGEIAKWNSGLSQWECGDYVSDAGYASTAGDADLLDGLDADQIQDADDYVSSAGVVSRLGFSITAVDSLGDVGRYSSVTVGADGLPFISYYGHHLDVAHCGNAACSANNTVTRVDWNVGLYTSVTVGADGLPLISYYDLLNHDLKVAHCGNAACSAGNTITTVDSAGYVGEYTSVTVGADGLPVISYYDDWNFYLKVAHCGNAACSAGNTITTVDSGLGLGGMYYTSVTVGTDGLPLISYYDDMYCDLKVAHCGNAACSAGNTITTVDSAYGYTSVTVGADGLPLIGYFGSGGLTVAHCGNAACSAGNTITTVDSTGNVGRYTSVTVGADGLPVGSYWDGTNRDLKVAHCGNAACTAGNTITTVDSTGDVGEYTSVTVGADGLPLISYWDRSNDDLKVAHCSNRFCVPYHRPR